MITYKTDKFDHNWLPKLNITRVDEPERLYKTPEGKFYPSVTGWLGNVLDDGSLDNWRNAVGTQEADKIAKRAATRGTLLHENIETYLNNEEVSFLKHDYLNMSLFKSIIPVIERISNIKCIEYPLYSDYLKLAGTVDCVADFDGEISLIDFKSSKNIKDEETIESYWLQTTIYSLMIQERYNIRINNLVVLMANEFSVPSVYKNQRSVWIKRLQELITNSRKENV